MTAAIQDHVLARVAAAVDRIAGEVLDLTVRLRDINGPRGGVDKSCQIVATLRHHQIVVVDAVDADLYAAVDRAGAHLRDQVCRRLGRRRACRQVAQKRRLRHLLA